MNEKEEKAIQKLPIEANGRGLQLRSLDDYFRWADGVVKSNLAPQSYKTAAQVMVATQAGAELGFSPFQALQVLHVVNGRVGISSTAIGGLIRARGNLQFMKQFYEGEPFNDDFSAVVVSKRRDEETEHRSEYSIADAKQAKLWQKSGSWQSDPKDMLMWRALSKHGRRYYGDVLSGLYTAEELHDLRPEQDYAPETPKRAERKQVESQALDEEPEPVATEADPLISTAAEGVLNAWLDKRSDLKIADNAEVMQEWAELCATVLDGVPDDYLVFDANMNLTFRLDGFTQESLLKLKAAVDGMAAFSGTEPAEEAKPKPGLWCCQRCGQTYAYHRQQCETCFGKVVEADNGQNTITEPDESVGQAKSA